jgi:hypothetical protein
LVEGEGGRLREDDRAREVGTKEGGAKTGGGIIVMLSVLGPFGSTLLALLGLFVALVLTLFTLEL